MMIITDFVKGSLDVAKRVAEILNAHWDTHGQPDPRDAEIDRLKAEVDVWRRDWLPYTPADAISGWCELAANGKSNPETPRHPGLNPGSISRPVEVDALIGALEAWPGKVSATPDDMLAMNTVSAMMKRAASWLRNGRQQSMSDELYRLLSSAKIEQITSGLSASEITFSFRDGHSATLVTHALAHAKAGG